MRYDNPLYKNQGIHTVNSIFTVQDSKLKVLLIKRSNAPYKTMWTLVSGAVYNNETLEDSAKREIFEKTGIDNLGVKLFNIYSKIDRAPEVRMLGVANIAVIDYKKVEIINETLNTSDAKWFDVKKLPKLGFDHDEIIVGAIEYVKEQIYKTDIVKDLLPKEFTIPNLHEVYQVVLETTIDRRNFSKKIINLNLLKDLEKLEKGVNKKPAKLYSFNKNIVKRVTIN